ncbi:hypothetical protein B0H11DRAFT_2229132 [Mycena galericulata]|nr:hypothetical protein B0H11DRAFT_2229132 [Mycena galericulata]
MSFLEEKSSRGDLVGLLQEYSKKKDWSNLEPQSSQSHKGQRDDSAPTRLTQLRNKAIADGTLMLPPPSVRTTLPADDYLRPKQTMEERRFILDCVDEIVRENPMLPPEERRPPQPKSDAEWKEDVASRVASTQERVDFIAQVLTALGGAVGLTLPPPSTSNVPSSSTGTLPSSPTNQLPSSSASTLPSSSTSKVSLSSSNSVLASSTGNVPRADSPDAPSLGPPALFPGRQDLPLPPNDGFLSYDSRTALAKIMKHWDPERPEWDPEHDWFQHRGSFVALKQYPELYKHTELWQDHSGELRKKFSRYKASTTMAQTACIPH